MEHCYLMRGVLLSMAVITVSSLEDTSWPIATTVGELSRRIRQDADVTNSSCISNWKQLLDMFRKENPLFEVNKGTMMILCNVRTFARNAKTGDTAQRLDSACCTLNDSRDDCRMVVIFVQSIFGAYPPPLLLTLGDVIMLQAQSDSYEALLQRSLQELCLAPPIPFCHGISVKDIIRDFTTKLLRLKVADGDNVYLEAWSFIPDRFQSQSYYTGLVFYAMVLCMSLTILMLTLWVARRRKHSLRPKAPAAKALLFSIMVQSWIWFLYLYGYQFWGLTNFKNFLLSRGAVLSLAYMPFVRIGYIMFGIMGALFLVEFPFLLWYINAKVLLPDGSQCPLSSIQFISSIFKSIGCAGIVLLGQVLPTYCLCFSMFFLTFPLVSLLLVCGLVVIFFFLSACTALVILPCLTGCRRCPQNSCFIVFLILLALSCAGVLTILSWMISYSVQTMFNVNSITSGLFVSFTFALLGFTLRSLLYQKADQYREDYLLISP